MKFKKITCLILVGMLTLTSCVKDDLDDLQNQIDNLNSTVDNLKKTQQEALLAAIAALQADMASLSTKLVGDLKLLENEVANNAKAVYYGNLITDADYAAFTAQGATIITGKVVVSNNSNITALANVKLIGKNLEIKGGTTIAFPALQSIGENFMVSDVSTNATISLSKLASIGGNFDVMNNSGLTSVTANELVLISGKLSTKTNLTLKTLSLAKLDQVDSISINEQVETDYDSPEGELNVLDLSSTNVNRDVHIQYISTVSNLALGSVGGDFICEYSTLAKITLTGAKVGGDFIVEQNKKLSSIVVASLSRIEGKLKIVSNYDYNTPGSGLVTMPSFAALQYIGGNVDISSNQDLKNVDSFNNVKEVRGTNIEFSGNGNLDIVNIFNALVDTANPATQYGDNSNASITVNANTFWFTGFKAIKQALNLEVSVSRTAGKFNEVTGEFEPGGSTAKLDGFDNLTDVTTLSLTVTEITSFNAFAKLNNFKNFGIYFTIYMPDDASVSLCSMKPILDKIKNGAFDVVWNVNKKAVFMYQWGEMDRNDAINQLVGACL